jgi:4-hydroxy-2-oxoheptanedioate aldolase
MGYSPSVKAGERRAAPVLEAVDQALGRIRAAGKVAGTLVVKQDADQLVKAGAQLLYYHADPFVELGVRQLRAITAGEPAQP